MDGPERFRIGPLQGATVVLIALPFIVAGLGLAGGQRAVGLGTAGLLVLCYGIVWIHRREGRPILCTPASPRAFVEAGQSP